MRKRKLILPKKFIFVVAFFILLIAFLIWMSFRKEEQANVTGAEAVAEERQQTETERDLKKEFSDSSEEVNAENDREHLSGIYTIPIEGAEEYLEPIMNWWQYKLYERLETYVERYVPEATKAVCIGSAPCETNSDIIYFYMELNDRRNTLIEAEYDVNLKEVTVREHTTYTREEIIDEVWITGSEPAIRDLQ